MSNYLARTGKLIAFVPQLSRECPNNDAGCIAGMLSTCRPTKLKHIQLPKEKMFDKSGQWIHLETFDDFDNGLSDLIELWSSTATQAVKDSALAHFKENLEGAMLNWADNRAKMKKFAAIGKELAEFEEALK